MRPIGQGFGGMIPWWQDPLNRTAYGSRRAGTGGGGVGQTFDIPGTGLDARDAYLKSSQPFNRGLGAIPANPGLVQPPVVPPPGGGTYWGGLNRNRFVLPGPRPQPQPIDPGLENLGGGIKKLQPYVPGQPRIVQHRDIPGEPSLQAPGTLPWIQPFNPDLVQHPGGLDPTIARYRYRYQTTAGAPSYGKTFASPSLGNMR